jgi:hypothetical protein
MMGAPKMTLVHLIAGYFWFLDNFLELLDLEFRRMTLDLESNSKCVEEALEFFTSTN